MQIPSNAHIAVVDGSQFRLFQAEAGAGTLTLKGIKTDPVHTTNRSGGAHDHDATQARDGGREMDELAHGAGVVEFLNAEVLAHRIEALVVIADPDTLGEMRRHYHKELEGVLAGELAKTLTNNPVEDIVKALENA